MKLLFLFFLAQAQSVKTIKPIDMTNNSKPQAGFVLVQFNLKAPSSGHSVIHQFSRRVRIDFDGIAIPKGKYALAVSDSCPFSPLNLDSYKKSWSELHQFTSKLDHIQTEKSLPQYSLRDASDGKTPLVGKSLALFRIDKKKMGLVDCKAIREGD